MTFVIQFYGECWASEHSVEYLMKKAPKSNSCVNKKYKACKARSFHHDVAGRNGLEMKVNSRACAGNGQSTALYTYCEYFSFYNTTPFVFISDSETKCRENGFDRSDNLLLTSNSTLFYNHSFHYHDVDTLPRPVIVQKKSTALSRSHQETLR